MLMGIPVNICNDGISVIYLDVRSDRNNKIEHS